MRAFLPSAFCLLLSYVVSGAGAAVRFFAAFGAGLVSAGTGAGLVSAGAGLLAAGFGFGWASAAARRTRSFILCDIRRRLSTPYRALSPFRLDMEASAATLARDYNPPA